MFKKLMLLAIVILLFFSIACHKKGPKKAEPVELISVEELYEKGQYYLNKKRTATARKYFEQIILREEAKEYREKAEVAIADSYFKEKNIESFAEAISRYSSFLAFHPMHPLAAYCQYQIGLCYFREIDTPDRDMVSARSSKEAFKKVIENYPNSEYVQDAKEKIKEIDNILAAHEIYVGDFYLKRGHPKAALERYKTVLKEYPDYWNIPLVYMRLAEAARMDKNFEEAKEFLQKVMEMVPNTNRAKEAERMLHNIDKKQTKFKKKNLEPLRYESEKDVPKEKKKRWWQFWRKK